MNINKAKKKKTAVVSSDAPNNVSLSSPSLCNPVHGIIGWRRPTLCKIEQICVQKRYVSISMLAVRQFEIERHDASVRCEFEGLRCGGSNV